MSQAEVFPTPQHPREVDLGSASRSELVSKQVQTSALLSLPSEAQQLQRPGKGGPLLVYPQGPRGLGEQGRLEIAASPRTLTGEKPEAERLADLALEVLQVRFEPRPELGGFSHPRLGAGHGATA